MTFKDRMLEIIRAHPEGITTIEMAVLMGGDYNASNGRTITLRSNISQAGKRLEKYGLVRREHKARFAWDLRKVTWWYPSRKHN